MATHAVAMGCPWRPEQRNGTGARTTIHAHDLQPSDVLVHDGRHHELARVDRRDGWAWPVAADGTGWAIALDHQSIDVHRPSA